MYAKKFPEIPSEFGEHVYLLIKMYKHICHSFIHMNIHTNIHINCPYILHISPQYKTNTLHKSNITCIHLQNNRTIRDRVWEPTCFVIGVIVHVDFTNTLCKPSFYIYKRSKLSESI
jgi:hypothetical protein